MSNFTIGESKLTTVTEGECTGKDSLDTLLRTLRFVACIPFVRLLVLVALLCALAIRESLRLSAFSLDDIWLHLRTGAWILQNHAIPYTGLFSQIANSPWVASSWLYDVLISALYALVGLRAVPLMLMFFGVALAATAFVVAGGKRIFSTAVALSAMFLFIVRDLVPLPVAFSMCFFGLTVRWLLGCRRRSELRSLFWLPALFWLWANLDPQFILGLLLLAIFLLAEIVERLRCHSNPTRIPLVHLAVITGACLVAVLLTPYSIRLMPAAIQTVYSPVLFNNFASMSPMSFRAPEHFVLTFLVVAACFGLGRQHSLDLFKILLLAIFAILSFRVQKDNWTVAFVAIAVLGEASLALQDAPVASASVRSLKSNLQLATGVVIVLIALFLRFPTNQTLDHRLESVMPAKACDYIRSNSLPAPLFNEYRWGGYVMWKLPQYPVAIDERTNLYGDEGSAAYFEVVMGKKRMETLPSFSSAQTILLPVGLTMTKALTTLPVLKEQFREVYRDDVAVVLVRRYPLPAPFAASFASTQDK